MLVVVIIHSEVGGKSQGCIALILAVGHLYIDTSAPTVGDIARICAFHHQVGRGECSGRGAELIVTFDFSVVEISQSHGPGAMITGSHAVTDTSKIAAAHVVHIVDIDLHIEFGTDQRRILVGRRHVVLDHADIVSAKSHHMRGGGDVEEMVRVGRLLRDSSVEDAQHGRCGQRRPFDSDIHL